MLIAPGGQTNVNVELIIVDQTPWFNRFGDELLDGHILHIGDHLKDDFPTVDEVVPSKSIDYVLRNASKAHTPAFDHPWRKFNLNKNVTKEVAKKIAKKAEITARYGRF